MNEVFELAGDLVPAKVAHDLMRLIAEGAGEEDEDADSKLRSSAVPLFSPSVGTWMDGVACSSKFQRL